MIYNNYKKNILESQTVFSVFETEHSKNLSEFDGFDNKGIQIWCVFSKTRQIQKVAKKKYKLTQAILMMNLPQYTTSTLKWPPLSHSWSVWRKRRKMKKKSRGKKKRNPYYCQVGK